MSHRFTDFEGRAHNRKISSITTNIGGYCSVYIMMNTSQPEGTVAVLRMETHEGAGFIRSVFVEPLYQSLGIGTKLLERAFQMARAEGFQFVGLHVANDNPRARALYERLGFRPYLNGYEGHTQMVKPL